MACVSCEVGKSSHAEGAQTDKARAGASVEASVCPECHGTGSLIEFYNHRRLESYCKNCEGRGVRVFRNGVEVKEGAKAAPASLHSGNVAGPAGVVALHASLRAGPGAGGDSDEEDGEAAAKRVAALEQDLARLEAKEAAYKQERADALALADQPAAPGVDRAGRDAAARQLAAALQAQLGRVGQAVARRRAQLERLRVRLGRVEGAGEAAGEA
ncbi:hypothetical protein HYH03_008723 [Edaphochlamys debaryana]|uniref:Uncharacterized protein n=1 Tax=Edaphochlamys debaryana TaxID=47281 RepID=A0A836BXZ5_9CHLO|nr:hypothetical protein HYH03_008723 [Edaphochlamys debaryana]|eukprot:KAG2493060.1 hypothetical protein HYH03_008723 [Edaphochlamys debaryana]